MKKLILVITDIAGNETLYPISVREEKAASFLSFAGIYPGNEESVSFYYRVPTEGERVQYECIS